MKEKDLEKIRKAHNLRTIIEGIIYMCLIWVGTYFIATQLDFTGNFVQEFINMMIIIALGILGMYVAASYIVKFIVDKQ